MTTDLISDMLTRIRNASYSRQNITYIKYSKINIAILTVLANEGYIKNFKVEKISEKKKIIKTSLKYKGWWIKKSFFSKIQRISKPGQKIFLSYKDFSKKLINLKYKQGIAIISTSSGIMSHNKAIKLKKGGEILCYIE
jgi:small subunit ribosomal protein S8